MNFNELPLSENVLRAVEFLGYEQATPIQAQAIPLILSGRDIIGRSSTGTGKTAAFGIPAVEFVSQQNDYRETCPFVLILSPTRELALQTCEELRKFSKYLQSVSVAAVYGGAAMDTQIRQLKSARIVVGTPGRIMDHLRRKTMRLDYLKTVILDEADEMLDMGFYEDIQTILRQAPQERQTLLFSATMPQSIMDITDEFQHDPQLIAVDGGQKTVDTISQYYYMVPLAGKIDALKLLLEYHHPKRALIFCNTKKMVDDLTIALNESGFRVMGLHGDLKQAQRNTVMTEFKSGRIGILIATDVAARGIDVENVDAVFNYDIPQENEYYIHRIGRTGRAGKSGASYTLATNRNQCRRIREIEKNIGVPIFATVIPSMQEVAANKEEAFLNELRLLAETDPSENFYQMIDLLIEEGLEVRTLAAALCANLAEKEHKLVNTDNLPNRDGAYPTDSNKTWLRVDIGSEDGIGPNFIVGAIADATGFSSKVIGKINIYSNYTDVALGKEEAEQVLQIMTNAKIKGKSVTFTYAKTMAKEDGSVVPVKPERRRRDKAFSEKKMEQKKESPSERKFIEKKAPGKIDWSQFESEEEPEEFSFFEDRQEEKESRRRHERKPIVPEASASSERNEYYDRRDRHEDSHHSHERHESHRDKFRHDDKPFRKSEKFGKKSDRNDSFGKARNSHKKNFHENRAHSGNGSFGKRKKG